MLQNIVVALIVAAALVSVGRRFLPAKLRAALALRLDGGLRAARLPALADRLQPRAQSGAGCDTGCASCDNCGPTPAAGGRREIPIKQI